LNCCERKTLFQLKKEAEQAGFKVRRTGPKHLETQVMFDLFIMMVNGVERDERE